MGCTNPVETQRRSRRATALWDELCSLTEFHWISQGASFLDPTFPKENMECQITEHTHANFLVFVSQYSNQTRSSVSMFELNFKSNNDHFECKIKIALGKIVKWKYTQLAFYKSSRHCCQQTDFCLTSKPRVTLSPYLDERSDPWSTQHRHLPGVDAVGPVLTRVVHAQDPVQHLLLLAVAWGRHHAVSTGAQLQGRCHRPRAHSHNTTTNT